MEFEKLMVRLEGASPLIMHNIQLANPLNTWAQALKEYSGKRKKTEDDHAEMSKLEWYGGLYTGKNDKGKDVVILPSEVLLGSFISGAKQSRLGVAFKCGFDVPMDALLEYDGPRDIDKLWADGRFTDVRGVAVQKSRIMRTRPIFMTWACDVLVVYRPDVLNESQVVKALRDAGSLCGVGDYRPRYGRYMVEVTAGAKKR